MSIRDWPETEQPREKLLRQGVTFLSGAELLAIFLRTGVRGKSAVDLARDMVLELGGLRGVFQASEETLCQMPGLGQTKYAQLQAVLELGRRYLMEEMRRGKVMENPSSTREYLQLKLRHLPYEVFCCLYLDNQHRILGFEELFRGTINAADVYPREVLKQALDYQAAAVILAHNHPSGKADPSMADHALTKKLRDALGLVDIRVLDHFIIGDGAPVSFAERGWL